MTFGKESVCSVRLSKGRGKRVLGLGVQGRGRVVLFVLFGCLLWGEWTRTIAMEALSRIDQSDHSYLTKHVRRPSDYVLVLFTRLHHFVEYVERVHDAQLNMGPVVADATVCEYLPCLNWLIRSYFVGACAAVLLARKYRAVLRPLLVYGKTAQGDETSEQSDAWSIRRLAGLTVPRSWFMHFYLLSSCLGLLLGYCFAGRSTLAIINNTLVLSHSIRRLWETCCIERPSGSRMWVGHYVVGISFYIFMNLSVVSATLCLSATNSVTKLQAGCVLMCLLAQIVQHQEHRHLANVRTKCQPGQYIDHRHGLFRFLVAPHYTAEIVIYLSLAVLNHGNANLSFTVLWTIAILGTSALQTDEWGRQKFPTWGSRWILIPGIF